MLIIQVRQERCSIMDAVQLAPEDRVRKKIYHLSKIKIPTFDEAVDNLKDILHSGTENVHLLSFGKEVYRKSPAAVLQPKEESIFQQPCSSSPHLEAVFTDEVCFLFQALKHTLKHKILQDQIQHKLNSNFLKSRQQHDESYL